MFDSRTLDKIIGESNQLENKETKISNVHISKMPKEHYQIVVKNKKESDQNERQKEKRKVNLDEDQSIEKKNKWEIKQDRGNKEVFTVMSAANAKKPKEKEIRVREEKVYTMLQSVCRTKDLENRKREEKNKKQLSGNIREAMDGSKSCLGTYFFFYYIDGIGLLKNLCIFSNKKCPKAQGERKGAYQRCIS